LPLKVRFPESAQAIARMQIVRARPAAIKRSRPAEITALSQAFHQSGVERNAVRERYMRGLILTVTWFGMGVLITALTVDAMKVRAGATRTVAGVRAPVAAPASSRTHRIFQLTALGRDAPETDEQVRPKSK